MKVIAEVGSNFKTHDDCVQSIRLAKLAGADVVKFQHFTGKDLYGPCYQGSRSLSIDIEALHAEASMKNIEFMCTAFSPKGYDLVDPYVSRHKVASSEITDLDILERVNSYGKPVILSTGGATNDIISKALLVLRNVPVTLLYCEVAYPAYVTDLRRMVKLRRLYGVGCQIGFSDHSIDVLEIPKRAKNLGAVLIEKHVNFTTHTDTPDAGHSLNKDQLALMIRHLKNLVAEPDTFKPNPYQRIEIKLPNGGRGYFRPMPE